MYVKIEFIVETPEFGKPEFRKEIEKLIREIDPSDTHLNDFDMYEVDNALLHLAQRED